MLTIKRRINFFECDPAGILFYGNIFFFCHTVYEELIASFNFETNYWQNEEFVTPIINSNAEYIKPFKYGDSITIELVVSDLRNSSFELSYKCLNQSNELCALVKTVHVFVDKKSWKKAELIPEIKDGLTSHLITK
jgi:1,4-dihydroxy-2-naphthoyl-CoA hydrolase